jgi:tetratricopeptide (TPR) repeat protein
MNHNIVNFDRNPQSKIDEEEYQSLLRSLLFIDGFGLLFVRSSPQIGNEIIKRIQKEIADKRFEILKLDKPIDSLYPLVEELPHREEIDVLFVTGLEYSIYEYEKNKFEDIFDDSSERYSYSQKEVPRVLGHLNLHRDRFRDNFNICFVFIVPLFVLKYLIRRSPDFLDWRSGVFEFPDNLPVMMKETEHISRESKSNSNYFDLTTQKKIQKMLEIRESLSRANKNQVQQTSLLLELGNLQISAEEYKEAIRTFDKVIEINPDEYSAWFYKGYILQKLERYEEAVESYTRSIKIKPDLHYLWHRRGDVLKQLERYEEALDNYNYAQEVDSECYNGWIDRGIVLKYLERYSEAIFSYDRALAIDPNNHYAWHNRAIALKDMGKYDEAIENYKQAQKINETCISGWKELGLLLESLGRYDEAINTYDKYLDIEPEDREILLKSGWILQIFGDKSKASNILRKIIETEPITYKQYLSKFVALVISERFDELSHVYQKLLELNPDNQDSNSWFVKSVLTIFSGRIKEAIYCLKKVYQIQPNFYKIKGLQILSLLHPKNIKRFATQIFRLVKILRTTNNQNSHK